MAINPGPGSVIYRGLAAVNIGGVIVSLVFSLILIPALIRLFGARHAVAEPIGAAAAFPGPSRLSFAGSGYRPDNGRSSRSVQ